MIKSQLANLYNRIPQLHGDFNTGGMCETDDAMYCGTLTRIIVMNYVMATTTDVGGIMD